jgi:hypothetical protein
MARKAFADGKKWTVRNGRDNAQGKEPQGGVVCAQASSRRELMTGRLACIPVPGGVADLQLLNPLNQQEQRQTDLVMFLNSISGRGARDFVGNRD